MSRWQQSRHRRRRPVRDSGLRWSPRRRGREVRQGPAKPRTAVRIRSAPCLSSACRRVGSDPRHGRGSRLLHEAEEADRWRRLRELLGSQGFGSIGTFVFSIPAVLLYDPGAEQRRLHPRLGVRHPHLPGARCSKAFWPSPTSPPPSSSFRAVVLFPAQARERGGLARLCRASHRRVDDHRHRPHQPHVRRDVARRPRGNWPLDPGSLKLAGQSLVAFHDWTFLLGPQFCAGFGNGLLLGYLMYKSELVPPRMALLGLIGGPLAFFGAVLVLFGVLDQPSAGLFVHHHPGDRVGRCSSRSISPGRGSGRLLCFRGTARPER